MAEARQQTPKVWVVRLCLVIVAMNGVGVRAVAQGVTVPRLISIQRLELYLQYLHPSDAQSAEITRLHNAYLAQWSENFDQDIRTLNSVWQSAYTSPEEFEGESMAEAFREAKALADRLRIRLKGANDFFFDQVEAILAQEQLNGVRRMRLAHDRWSFARSKNGAIPECHIDLARLLDEFPFEPEDQVRVESFLNDFEPVFVQALKNTAEADERRAVVLFEVLDIGRSLNATAPDEVRIAEMDRLRERAGKLGTNASKRLVDMNRRGLRQVSDILSSQTASEITRRYNEWAYPQVYPDPAFAGSFYKAVLSLEDLEVAQREALAMMDEEYRAAHRRVSEAMAKCIFVRAVLIYGGIKSDREKADAEYSELIRQGVEREKLDLVQPARIRSLLLPNQAEHLPELEYDKSEPPRPWDPQEKRKRPQPTTRPEPSTRPQSTTQPISGED